MKYDEARSILDHALNYQKVISISRLKPIMEVIDNRNKRRINWYKEKHKQTEERLVNQRREIARMNRHTEKLQERLSRHE